MSPVIAVEPDKFRAASRVFGSLIADDAYLASNTLLLALNASAGMAGTDPVGLDWASAYDDAASATVQATQDVINGSFRLAALLEATGFNYAGAENASTHLTAWSDPDTTGWEYRRAHLAAPPSAAGGSGSLALPGNWHLVSDFVDAVWPDGHQDRLRAAARAWTTSADAFDRAAAAAPTAETCILAERFPESDAALTACRAMARHLADVAAAHAALAAACNDYAHHLDQAHHEIISELVELAAWTAGIEVAGGVLALFTAGISEIAAQGAEIIRLTATARAIDRIVETLQLTVRGLAANTRTVLADAGATSERLSVLLRADPVYARARKAKKLAELRKGHTSKEAAAILSLVQAGDVVRWSRIPARARGQVAEVLERARRGSVRFVKHDGKRWRNDEGMLPPGTYHEWPAVANGASRRWVGDRVIFEGDERFPMRIWYWDHKHKPVVIWP